MGTEPGGAVLGGETELEARLPGRRGELGSATLPLARGGDKFPPDIGISVLRIAATRPLREAQLPRASVRIVFSIIGDPRRPLLLYRNPPGPEVLQNFRLGT